MSKKRREKFRPVTKMSTTIKKRVSVTFAGDDDVVSHIITPNARRTSEYLHLFLICNVLLV